MASYESLPQGVREAQYGAPQLRRWAGNPLIENMPAVPTLDEIVASLRKEPDFLEADRGMDDNLRISALDALRDFYYVLPQHVLFYQKFGRSLRGGWVKRNPADALWWADMERRFAATPNMLLPSHEAGSRSSGLGLTVIGFPGLGKTTTLEKVCGGYPQVSVHREYRGRPLPALQVAWLMISAPYAGSIRDLCRAILGELGRVTGHDYLKDVGNRASAPDLLDAVRRAVALTHLGVLILDEVQHLAKSFTAGELVLNFLVNLENTTGVPVVLVGTHKARDLLESAFHQIRRNEGGGSVQWGRMTPSEWSGFADKLWQYQWNRHPLPLTPHIRRTMFDLTQGIPDFAVRLFVHAQELAILNGSEVVDARLLRRASCGFPGTMRAINILRGGGTDAQVDDLLTQAAGERPGLNSIAPTMATPAFTPPTARPSKARPAKRRAPRTAPTFVPPIASANEFGAPASS